MDAVTVLSGTAVPLDRSDVDTDQIIPSDWLKRVERTGFGAGLFSEWRDDRDFVMNQPEYAGASILVAGPNFGTGSSREQAGWAIMDYGFQAVISPRFADIFRNNCTKNGLVPVQVDEAVGRRLLEAVVADPTVEITVDVDRRTVSAPALGIEEPLPKAYREALGIGQRAAMELTDDGLLIRAVAEERGGEGGAVVPQPTSPTNQPLPTQTWRSRFNRWFKRS